MSDETPWWEDRARACHPHLGYDGNLTPADHTRTCSRLPPEEVGVAQLLDSDGRLVTTFATWIGPSDQRWRTPKKLYVGNREFIRNDEALTYCERTD